jgi:hypothetical protein
MKIERRTESGLTEGALSFFWWGGTLGVGQGFEWRKGKSESEVLEFWKKHRKGILTWYVEKCRLRKMAPGRRPNQFWDEITEPRRKTGVEKWWGPHTKDGPPKKQETEIIYETDYQFLKRLNLLQGWELDFKPPEKAKKKGKNL